MIKSLTHTQTKLKLCIRNNKMYQYIFFLNKGHMAKQYKQTAWHVLAHADMLLNIGINKPELKYKQWNDIYFVFGVFHAKRLSAGYSW